MLTAIYCMLRDGVPYDDLGHDHFDRADEYKATGKLVRKLEALGYQVELEKAA